MLEQPGIGALEHRAANHEAIGLLDRLDDGAGAVVEPDAGEGGDAAAGIDEVENVGS
ncbi:hypothetical protein ACU4GH_29580 [Bradyrhizobium betae]